MVLPKGCCNCPTKRILNRSTYLKRVVADSVLSNAARTSSQHIVQHNNQANDAFSPSIESPSDVPRSLGIFLHVLPAQRTYSIERFEVDANTSQVEWQQNISGHNTQNKKARMKLLLEEFDAAFDGIWTTCAEWILETALHQRLNIVCKVRARFIPYRIKCPD